MGRNSDSPCTRARTTAWTGSTCSPQLEGTRPFMFAKGPRPSTNMKGRVPFESQMLQAGGEVPEAETVERPADSARESHRLEALSHLARQQQRGGALQQGEPFPLAGSFRESRELALDPG